MKKISLYKKILTCLDPRWDIRFGAVPENGKFRYVVSAVRNGFEPRVLSYSCDITKALFSIPPLGLNTTFIDTKVSFITSPLNNENADSWLDRNEERVIPYGFTSDQVVNEWDVLNGSIYSATVTKESLNEYFNEIDNNRYMLSSISVPLWDLAILYSGFVKGGFVIWKITKKGSILGYVKENRLKNCINFWPDYDDLKKDTDEVCRQLSRIIRSLTSGEDIVSVIPFVDKEQMAIPSDLSIPDYSVEMPPQIDSVPEVYHEAYSCSIHQKTDLDFANFHDKQNLQTLKKKRKLFLNAFWVSIMSIVGVILVLAFSVGVITVIQRFTEKRIEPLNTYIEKIESGEHQLDSLETLYKRKAGFLGKESIITFLMNEMQLIFPEGVWAEQIEISESEEKLWRIHIIAISYSTALIPKFLSNLEKIEGINNVRMIYSEQVKIGKTKHAIKNKIECSWKI